MRIRSALLLLLAAGCGGPDLSTHEGITDAMIEATEDLADVIEGITDKKSAEGARPVLQEIAKRMRDIDAALRALGEPVGDERKRLKARLEAATQECDSRIDRTLERLRAETVCRRRPHRHFGRPNRTA